MVSDKVVKQKRKSFFDYNHQQELHKFENEYTWSERMINRKRIQFHSERGLTCEVCWDKRADWISNYGDYFVTCDECRDRLQIEIPKDKWFSPDYNQAELDAYDRLVNEE